MADHDSITADELRAILHYDPLTGVFTRIRSAHPHRVGAVVGSVSRGYILIGLLGKLYKAHRLAWLYVYGTWPKDQIDHINRNRSDNRIANLRDVTNQQNMCNVGVKADNTSGHSGISWDRRRSRFRVRITRNYKAAHLGYFKSFDEAVAARLKAEVLNGVGLQM